MDLLQFFAIHFSCELTIKIWSQWNFGQFSKDGRKEDDDTFYIFNFISGFNNHSVGEEILPESKWNVSPRQGVKNTHSCFRVDISKFSVFLEVGDNSIRCFRYRLLLAEAAATGGRVSQHAAKRTGGFPTSSRRKKVFPIQRSMLKEDEILSCALKFVFRPAQFELPVMSSRELLHFLNLLLFFFHFIFLSTTKTQTYVFKCYSETSLQINNDSSHFVCWERKRRKRTFYQSERKWVFLYHFPEIVLQKITLLSIVKKN